MEIAKRRFTRKGFRGSIKKDIKEKGI